MEQYKETVSKYTPAKLVNALLKLYEDLANTKPEDVTLKTDTKAKIPVIQDLISKLKKDTDTVAAGVGLDTARNNDCDKLERSKAGHLAQITILVKKFEAEFNNLEIVFIIKNNNCDKVMYNNFKSSFPLN